MCVCVFVNFSSTAVIYKFYFFVLFIYFVFVFINPKSCAVLPEIHMIVTPNNYVSNHNNWGFDCSVKGEKKYDDCECVLWQFVWV